MLGAVHYVLRSRADGRYLVAQPDDRDAAGYLLLFKENHEARSYLNAFAADLAERLAIESVSSSQLKGLLQRWGYQGVALVSDPLAPALQFLELT